jgi:hypothetical protein
LKHSDVAGAAPPMCMGSCAGHSTVPSLKVEISETSDMLTADVFKGFNGGREKSCLPARLQRYKKHCDDGEGSYSRDVFFVREKSDRASYLARQMAMQLSDATGEHISTGHEQAKVKLLHETRQLRTILLRWGCWLVPVAVAAQWVNAVAQAAVGFLLVMWSGWLASDNRQWEFEHHFEDQNFRAVTLPAIGIGVICAGCAVFCCFRPEPAAPQADGGARPIGHDRPPQNQEAQQLADAICETRRLVQVQTFGALVIFVAKLLYWVGKDNFSGVLSSDLDEDLVLCFAALVVWWIVCVVIRLHV